MVIRSVCKLYIFYKRHKFSLRSKLFREVCLGGLKNKSLRGNVKKTLSLSWLQKRSIGMSLFDAYSEKL